MNRRVLGEVGRAIAVLAVIVAGGVVGFGSWALMFVQADARGMGVDPGAGLALGFLGLIWSGVCLVAAGVAGDLLVYGESRRARLVGIGVMALILACTGLLLWCVAKLSL
ncbi:Major facilitator superfamily (MFS) profile domain-containing protein OS=Tsukamurella paurometabola(strain ATCC 8368 / DSM / CCUG 35730 / CIP 100753 /JCM 10117 / KCTC 9821 / NBRC 16120 / NCIMB 702349 / NCTC 13040)OX=521096 GN=Tpau_0467 PE=4 SV=1 [Tsukamurella paurometabola]|uniref:Major facilitator superfamily (MFS) profile domain-containing protein n=1 Tax=Tsukamurella paurometabola (strain ATCC 8368 / DSM 20162 / CCUG 35730 / CIP 100753 / JCM 10117 / KCTC 9821 / NBRC 16120 / NCIMB 702349 / NCTC 13040) TaxID=521096 RepID=D5US41_TSUPD|nr:hypothetical protein [Tsukamurella paurometabola]ADG77108.1 hypothetical protein Tpau_0467 [Tsukamurella paurometabola DSM 20162]SUP42809.1 Uncharacterised protein [Tsukamurella paurometabola]